MSGKLFNLRKRLDKFERRLIDLAHTKKDHACNCRETTIADSRKPEEFEAEMNRMCHVHWPRQLGMIVHIKEVGREDANDIKLDQLLQAYRARQSATGRRLSQLRQAGVMLKNGS